jgi:hypothetical protein
VVGAGRAVRAALAQKILGLYYAPRLRTFYVALNAARVAVGDKLKVGELAAIENSVVAAMRAAFARDLEHCPAVRVGFGLPHADLVAVDNRSVVHWAARAAATLRRIWKPITVAALFGFGMTATAAADGTNGNEPAVSQTNVKLSGAGGGVDGKDAWEFNGALTAPLGQSMGLQVEGGLLGVDNDDTIYGGAAHLFTRDPDKYLLGLFAAYAEETDFDLDALRIGAEAEIYMKQISILAQAGYQFSDSVGDTAFGSIDLRWYATDNFYLSAGGNFEENVTQGRLGAEFMPGFSALPGLAFNVRGVVGDDDYESVMGGITYYFGANDSLKNRHRKQDPDSALLGLFQSIEQERARLESIYGTSLTPQ